MNIVPRKPYTILTGDVREMLRTLPDESVHCVVTSPPYWGLRDYGTEPGVWGGDEECDHVWGETGPGHHPGQVEQTKWKNADAAGKGQTAGSGQWCSECNAWRGQLGLEPTPEIYVEHMVEVFREVRRVLRNDGSFWLNMGDCYASSPPGNKPGTTSASSGLPNSRENQEMRRAAQVHKRDYGALKQKNLVGIPWRLAFALQADGWWIRQDIIWAKPNPMPESCRDRPTKSHEYIFLLTKAPRYFFDQEAVRQRAADSSLARIAQDTFDEQTGGPKDYAQTGVNPNRSARKALENFAKNPGANIRSVWTIPTQPFSAAHFAVFPEALPEWCIKAGTSEKGCCPECGAPWVRVVKRTSTVIDRSARTHDKGRTRTSGTMTKPPTAKTTGWKPSCSCAHPDHGSVREFTDQRIGERGSITYLDDPPTVPCTVLDPFVGSGTTALVAVRLGRRAIGIDLSAEYTKMVEKQLAVALLGGHKRPRKFKIKGRKKLKRAKRKGS
ncbi:hypothetical protein LCGC14_1603870 [marine sediment metagenome]|uniref:site-specific DNA-methyltransferase (cytosine-N(4)-specific) n=1 Tax=marine sediment metagenome TaxID=412755 RepID=A0A0F9IAE4_9ZZZZ